MFDGNVLFSDIIRFTTFRSLVFSKILNLPLIQTFQKILLLKPYKFRVGDAPSVLVYEAELFYVAHGFAFDKLELWLAVAKRNNFGISLYNNRILLGKIMEILLSLNRFPMVSGLFVIYVVIVFVFMATRTIFIRTTIIMCAFTFLLRRTT